jgi:hypothetical protein
MAELFSTYADFKTYIGGRANTSLKLESLEATIYETARRHITPWLGAVVYGDLVTAVATNNFSAAQTALLPYVRRPLAILTMYEWSKVGAVEVGESGIHRIEQENAGRKTAYRYQERQYQEDAQEKGYNALEEMLRFLDANNATYTAWRDSDEGLVHRTALLNYASDFRLLTMPECDRYTFEAIRPIIAEVELFGVRMQLPEAFWPGFITRHLAGLLTAEEKQLRTYIRQAIAHRSIQEAITQKWIRVERGRIHVLEDFGDQRSTNQTMPTGTGSGLYLSHQTWSDRFWALALEYIKANPDKFQTVFDEDSGGTNTDTDAWHINTDDEQAIVDAATVVAKSKGIYSF